MRLTPFLKNRYISLSLSHSHTHTPTYLPPPQNNPQKTPFPKTYLVLTKSPNLDPQSPQNPSPLYPLRLYAYHVSFLILIPYS